MFLTFATKGLVWQTKGHFSTEQRTIAKSECNHSYHQGSLPAWAIPKTRHYHCAWNSCVRTGFVAAGLPPWSSCRSKPGLRTSCSTNRYPCMCHLLSEKNQNNGTCIISNDRWLDTHQPDTNQPQKFAYKNKVYPACKSVILNSGLMSSCCPSFTICQKKKKKVTVTGGTTVNSHSSNLLRPFGHCLVLQTWH